MHELHFHGENTTVPPDFFVEETRLMRCKLGTFQLAMRVRTSSFSIGTEKNNMSILNPPIDLLSS